MDIPLPDINKRCEEIVSMQVQQVMSDVQQRHDQMRQLESSMLELHQVFLDMSILVADQGDTINNIDNWVWLLEIQ